MRITNMEDIINLSLRKKLTHELVRGIMDDINAVGIVYPEDKHLGKAVIARINTFLIGNGCDRLPLGGGY